MGIKSDRTTPVPPGGGEAPRSRLRGPLSLNSICQGFLWRHEAIELMIERVVGSPRLQILDRYQFRIVLAPTDGGPRELDVRR